jgi:hypothetical protein
LDWQGGFFQRRRELWERIFMRILIKLSVLIALFIAVDFVLLNGRYSARVWQEAQRHGQAMSTEATRWLHKAKL